MTTTLILIGIGVALLVAIGAVLFSRARKIRERGAVSRAIAAVQKAEPHRAVTVAEAAELVRQRGAKVGTVVKVDGNRVEIHGLGKLEKMEMLEFPHDVKGVARNSSEDKVEALLVGDYQKIKEGDLVKRVPQLIGESHLKIADFSFPISPDVPIFKFKDSLTDAISEKKISADWRSNSFSSGSPDRSEGGGRM